MRRTTLFLAILGLSALVGCGDEESKNLRKEAGEAWDAMKAWGVARRADAERLFAERKDDLAKAYEAAKSKAKAAGGDAEKALEAKWADVSQKLSDLKAAGADKWADARDAFVRAYESLKQEVSPGS